MKHFTWNKQYSKYDESYIQSFYRNKTPDGRLYRTVSLSAGGLSGGGYRYEWNGVTKLWRCPKTTMQRLHDEGRIYYSKTGVASSIQYLDEMPGVPLQDIWTDIGVLGAQAQERLGYPTQKPEVLLERIIQASSNEGDVILDPFCGCGTTINVAEKLNRKWIGIDLTHIAITLIKNRLKTTFGAELSEYEVIGDPKDLESAQALALQDRYQFEYWALGLVDARPGQDKKKGADGGIDGYINFFDDASGKAKSVIIQVKSGHVSVSQVRDLKGVLDREQSPVGVFICLEEPTGPMRQEALSAGFYDPEYFPDLHYPKIQILTISELLAGKEPRYPKMAPMSTFKPAPKFVQPVGQQDQLL